MRTSIKDAKVAQPKLSQKPCSEEIMTRMTGEDWVGFNDRIREWQAKRGYPSVKGKEIRRPVRLSNNQPKQNTPRAKWAGELEYDETEPSQFYKDKVIKRRYVVKKESNSLTQVYQRWYQQRKSDTWEEFEDWMDENYLEESTLKRWDANIVKEALVINRQSLEDRAED